MCLNVCMRMIILNYTRISRYDTSTAAAINIIFISFRSNLTSQLRVRLVFVNQTLRVSRTYCFSGHHLVAVILLLAGALWSNKGEIANTTTT